MRVILVSQYYPPETGGPPNRLHSIAMGLTKADHEVTVIAPKPNHPEGIIWPDYRDGFLRPGRVDGITVVYCSVYASPKKTFFNRIAFYLSFVFVSILAGLLAPGEWDIVIGSSPPLFVGISAFLIAKLRRCRFIFDVRDLWPDVAIALGALRNSYLVTLSRKLESFLYHRADGIAAVTDSFCEHVRRVAENNKPVELVMNGTVPEIFNKDVVRSHVRAELGIDDRFVVLFAGNIGLAQGLDHIVDAASILGDLQSDVVFLFLGSGPLKEHLLAEVAERGLHNVRFLPRTTLDDAADHISAADALLVPLGDHPVYRMFIPSKLFDSMAAGRPVLLSVDGEARAILEAAEAGIYYPAEDAESLVKAIQELKADPNAAAEMGRNGRKFAVANCSREEQARIMIRFIENIVGERKERIRART